MGGCFAAGGIQMAHCAGYNCMIRGGGGGGGEGGHQKWFIV
jgi:hypothetical protein